MFNVKSDINLNILPANEKESIWVPVITFKNTNDGKVTVNDKKCYQSNNITTGKVY